MANTASTQLPLAIQHPGEHRSNDVRRRQFRIEPKALRTFTPSLAVLAKGAGSFVWTPDDRKLADFTSGVLVSNLGHNPTAWWKRVIDYLQLGQLKEAECYAAAVPLTAYNAVTEIEILASERLVANMRAQPGGVRMEQVLWSASGSEAIQKAIWAALARRPGEEMVLATRAGFHGKKGLAGAVTGDESSAERDERVRFIRFPTDECKNIQAQRESLDVSPFEAELDAIGNELGSNICCLVTEPYLGAAGSYHPQPAYLQLLQRFCRERDIVFILDEIQSNFGRTGPMYAYTKYGLEPDIVCVGKGLANGVPVSAAVGRADVLDSLSFGAASDTWSANPLSSAAVLATLDEFENTDVLAHAAKLAEIIEAGLVRLTELDVVSNVRGEGLVWGVECAAVGGHSARDVANACVEHCYLGDGQGRAIHLLGPLADHVLRVSPPLTMPLDDAQKYLDVMYEIFSERAAEMRD